MPKTVLTDSGFWLALLDHKDGYYNQAVQIATEIDDWEIIFPWPCLYETISTRLVRNRERLVKLEFMLNRLNINKLSDEKYRNRALELMFESNQRFGHSYSLVDSVIREILKEKTLRIGYLATFNARDFQDVCDWKGVEII